MSADILQNSALENALDWFAKGEVTLGKAAQIAGVGVGEFMKIASAKGIPTCTTEIEDVLEDVEFLRDYLRAPAAPRIADE